MKVIEIREDSHKKLLKHAKKAEMILCDLVETLTELHENSKYEDREDYDDIEDDDDDVDVHYRRGSRGGRRYMRRGRYSY